MADGEAAAAVAAAAAPEPEEEEDGFDDYTLATPWERCALSLARAPQRKPHAFAACIWFCIRRC
jgi:hypothetical protein